MKDTLTWLTPKQAANLAGYTARHIQNLITGGKLCATKEDGKYYIDKSEFFRVFPTAHKKEQEGNSAQKAAEREKLQFENELLKEMSHKKDQEIEFLRSQVEFVSQEKCKMLDTIVSHTRMLEYKQDLAQKDKMVVKKKSWIDSLKRK